MIKVPQKIIGLLGNVVQSPRPEVYLNDKQQSVLNAEMVFYLDVSPVERARQSREALSEVRNGVSCEGALIQCI